MESFRKIGLERTVVLDVKDLTKTYTMGSLSVDALRGVNLTVYKGEFVAIMGPSGSGKSTLLHLLGGLDTPSKGQIILGGVETTHLSDDELTLLRRRKVGFIFQFFNLLPTLNAQENITLPILIDNRSPLPHAQYINELVELVGLSDRINHLPDQLSGGQQQRVAIARALVTRPEIILADEPTGNLDSRSSNAILRLLRRLCDDYQITIVMVTHDANAASYADRVVFLKDGMIEKVIDREHDDVTIQSIISVISQLEA